MDRGKRLGIYRASLKSAEKAGGFTLIELLVVVSIIALLVSILLPALNKARIQAKLVVCAAQQHQVLVGVIEYTADHNGKLPPSVQGRSQGSGVWTVPSRLNYHPYGVPGGQGNGFNGGVMYKYLGAYLPTADIYSCPMAQYDISSPGTDTVNNTEVTYQELYESGNSPVLHCSYFLLWNYQGWDYMALKKPFIGPGGRTKNTLLITDAFFYNDVSAGISDTWQVTHRFENASSSKIGTPQPIYNGLYDPGRTVFPEVQLNAGYEDGHVVRTNSENTTEMFTPTHTTLRLFITQDYR